MPYRPEKIGEMSVRESARVRAAEGDLRAKKWLESKASHDRRQRAEARNARGRRKNHKKVRL